MAVYPRFLHQTVLSDLRLYPVVAVMGARQVGKSTLCQRLAEELELPSCTLDDRSARQAALDDPQRFLADLGDGGFIDEVQRAPELTLALKASVDRHQRNGMFLISGSNQPAVGSAVSDSLLGRATYRMLRPLTLGELRFDLEQTGWSFVFEPDVTTVLDELARRATASGPLDWRDVAMTGGFPRAIAAPADQRLRVLDDYVEIFSTRDARELIAVDAPDRLETFVRLVGARTGQELNASSIAQELGATVTTVRRWLEVLQRSYLIELVQPYSRNAGNRVIKTPKLFVVDPALAMAAAGETRPSGFHLETLIANDLFVWKDAAPIRDIYHWRERGQEVDFVLEEGGQLVAVEVKSSTSVNREHGRHLRAFRDKYPHCLRGLVVSCDPAIRRLDDTIIACPWWALL